MTGERRIHLSPPHLSGAEIEQVARAFASNYVAPAGPQLGEFEREFCEYTGIGHAVAVSSGTAALHLALRSCGVGPGDRVLVSTLTFVGGVSPVADSGAEPIFVDSNAATWTMDPALVAEAVAELAGEGRRLAAVVPTDLYGQCADLDAIRAVCDPAETPVVTDSAEAMGATYKGRHAGAGARAAIFSFNGNKIITTGGGGMVASDDASIVARSRHLATQAREPTPWYEHRELGFNYRMGNVPAAIGIAQLRALNDRLLRKRQIFERYRQALGAHPAITFMPDSGLGRRNHWLTVCLIDPDGSAASPLEIVAALDARGIEARPLWKPMHLQPVFAGARCFGGGVAADLFARGLCLPSGTQLDDRDVDEIAGIVLAAVTSGAPPPG